MQYQYLIAGLEDITLTSGTTLTEEQLLQQFQDQLSKHDWQLLSTLFVTTDDDRIVKMAEDYRLRAEEADEAILLSEEDLRTQMLYEWGVKAKNQLLRQWFEFNLNINNVLAATICRKHGFDIAKAIIGNSETAEAIRKNRNQKDFGLAGTLPEINDILHLADIENLLDREKMQDALRWRWLEEHTLFFNFEIENVIAYYLQSKILHRWDNLTMEEGQRVFRSLVADMKKGITFEDEK
ncbi:MAG: DUF2764 domain-containing protein [Paludibacteraceae bacterium]|nr:DUF2764 domain-containing protein [Paludibacteraceae bacterium]